MPMRVNCEKGHGLVSLLAATAVSAPADLTDLTDLTLQLEDGYQRRMHALVLATALKPRLTAALQEAWQNDPQGHVLLVWEGVSRAELDGLVEFLYGVKEEVSLGRSASRQLDPAFLERASISGSLPQDVRRRRSGRKRNKREEFSPSREKKGDGDGDGKMEPTPSKRPVGLAVGLAFGLAAPPSPTKLCSVKLERLDSWESEVGNNLARDAETLWEPSFKEDSSFHDADDSRLSDSSSAAEHEECPRPPSTHDDLNYEEIDVVVPKMEEDDVVAILGVESPLDPPATGTMYVTPKLTSGSKRRQLWDCPVKNCPQILDFPSLVLHFEKSHGSRRRKKSKLHWRHFKCQICSAKLRSRAELLNHSLNADCQEIPPAEEEDGLEPEFSCQACPAKFHGFRHLEMHINWHHLTATEDKTLEDQWTLFICEVCQRVFHSQASYHLHQKQQHGVARGGFKETDFLPLSPKFPPSKLSPEEPDLLLRMQGLKANDYHYFCAPCGVGFSHRKKMTEHAKEHESESDFPCPRCPARFVSVFERLLHLRTDCALADIQCDCCQRTFGGLVELRLHRLDAHPHVRTLAARREKFEKIPREDGKVMFKCDACAKLFPTSTMLTRHQDGVHAKPGEERRYKCEHEGCCYQTNVLVNFRNHSKTHAKPAFVCEQCAKAFITGDRLKKHISIQHSSELIFQCASCPKMFTNEISLRRHSVLHGEKKHKCEVCGKCFPKSAYLRQHMAVHEVSREYKCETCGKDFKRKDKLTRHRKTHLKKELGGFSGGELRALRLSTYPRGHKRHSRQD